MARNILVNFLDVGQGDGTVILCPTGEIILIDLGSKKNADIAGADAIRAVCPMLLASVQYRKLDGPVLDCLVLTHGDGDHYNLIQKLDDTVKEWFPQPDFQPLKISKIVIGGVVDDYSKTFRDNFLSPAFENGNLITFGDNYHNAMDEAGNVEHQWSISEGAARLYVLSVNYPNAKAAKNAKSVVLMLEYVNEMQRVILTGDAEKETEAEIIKHYQQNPKFLESFALKLGHHGSVNATSKAWLNAVKPLACFASSDMKWAHPYCETTDRIKNTQEVCEHQWMCGMGAGDNKEYKQYIDSQGIYTNLASMAEKPVQDDEGIWYAPGLVQGVQWQLTLHDTGLVSLLNTLGHHAGPFVPVRPNSVPPSQSTPCGCK